ncbi:MAG: peroxiredoxin, partial [bacterium]|nr:peroxiredoxin [bacterium]
LGKNVILYFYPKDNTPGCTIEGKEFTQLKSAFDKKNAVILGVSKQGVESHQRFCKTYDFTIDLLADTEGKLHDVIGITSRSTVLVDERGIVKKIWTNVSPRDHAASVLQSIA